MTHNVSRRTLAKGVAWSMPAIAATTSIPAYAASSCTWKDINNTPTAVNYCPNDTDLNAGYFDPSLFAIAPDGTKPQQLLGVSQTQLLR